MTDKPIIRRTRHRWLMALGCLAIGMATTAVTTPARAVPTKNTTKTSKATPAPAPSAGRSVDAVLADHAQAVGGTKPWKGTKSLKATIAVTIKGLGISGTGARHQTADGNFHESLAIPGIGTLERGSNGKAHWSKDPINGLRLLDGIEAEQSRIDNAWMADLRAKELYRQIKTTASTNDAVECLELLPQTGPAIKRCFDKQTHLMISQEGMQITPQGETPYRLSLSDYREQDGVKMPYHHEITAGPVTMIMEIKQIVRNVAVDRKMFQLPRAD